MLGYKYNLCLRCSNGYQTEDLDNLVVSQCGKISQSSSIMPDFIHGYQDGAPNEDISLDGFIDNQDFMNCPLSCTILEQGCTDPFLGSIADISFADTSPISLSVSKTNALGFKYIICISCTNGFQTVEVDSWSVQQCIKFSIGVLSNIELGYVENAADT